MPYDVVIVGAGPAGLSCAIRIKQKNPELSVCVLEKSAQLGGHILSGAVIDPCALNELIPDWKNKKAPVTTQVTHDDFLFLTQKRALKTPHIFLPSCFKNDGCYVVRLGLLVQWLGQQAQELGVDIFEGFAVNELLYNEQGSIYGVATSDMGLNADGTPSAMYQPGVEIHATWTILSEGSRGSLGKEVITKFKLDEGKAKQSYAIGIKELWKVPKDNVQTGYMLHSAGWPLESDTYGGGFLYVPEDGVVAVGIVVGLNYNNPHLSPFEEFQRLKTHPSYQAILKGGKRIAYGARTITAGGLSAVPKLTFPGGALIGCEAGLLDASRIKGVHSAIYSGMYCADAIVEAHGSDKKSLESYETTFKQSNLHDELHQSRNFKNWFKKGTLVGTLMTGIERWLLRGHIPWTCRNTHEDHTQLKPAAECTTFNYTHHDPELQFDRLSSVFLSGAQHDSQQPSHIKILNSKDMISINLKQYDAPETKYCPAQVYELTESSEGKAKLLINFENCLHCKTCDIKDPRQNIQWQCPQGGDGPNYIGM
ncbi:MAG: electron transfer flavoprotein-ubiquinone oxidoreductase [Alcaligenaceae bacterium]|nr:electron transfer flavoprotein-ubiquinone oxidoreductase [Alcaligenaceae bacterium]